MTVESMTDTLTVQFKGGKLAKVTGSTPEARAKAEEFGNAFVAAQEREAKKKAAAVKKEKTLHAENIAKYGSPLGKCDEDDCGKGAVIIWKAPDSTQMAYCRKHNTEYERESKKQYKEVLPTLVKHEVYRVLGKRSFEVDAVVQAVTTKRPSFKKTLVRTVIRAMIKDRDLSKDGLKIKKRERVWPPFVP